MWITTQDSHPETVQWSFPPIGPIWTPRRSALRRQGKTSEMDGVTVTTDYREKRKANPDRAQAKRSGGFGRRRQTGTREHRGERAKAKRGGLTSGSENVEAKRESGSIAGDRAQAKRGSASIAGEGRCGKRPRGESEANAAAEKGDGGMRTRGVEALAKGTQSELRGRDTKRKRDGGKIRRVGGRDPGMRKADGGRVGRVSENGGRDLGRATAGGREGRPGG